MRRLMETSPNPPPRSPKVFISYSHDSEEHRGRVRGLHASLARDGCDGQLDLHKDTDEDWPMWMTKKLKEADFILCVITETYARRFDGQELPDVGLGVGWEAGLIRRLLYGKKLHNDRIFPAVFADQDRHHIPIELQGYDHFLLNVACGYEALLRKILKQPQHLRPAIGTAPNLVATTASPLFPRPGDSSPPTNAVNVDISRILKYAPAELIGREHELNLLTAALNSDLHGLMAYPVVSIKHRPRVLTFVALGGEGKTSLVAKWAAELAVRDWSGCDAVFAWSFYSQGTRDQVAASSDLFLKEALLFFGNDADKEFAASNAGAFEKGQRLARIVGQRRSLLILDGLEPLQYSPASPTPGELKDQGIRALLRGLATSSHGLCVVTTRYSVPDLKAFWQTTAAEVPLLRLCLEAGEHLLKTLGVKGTAKEFEALVEDVKGHALTLTLLGGFLKRAFHGDIRQRDRVKFEKADAQMDGGHAFRTMAAYEEWLLSDGGDEGQREVSILRLMGLFDRPADASCLAALRRETIPDLTEPLAELADDDWEYCLSGLEAAKLLTVNRDASGALVSLDAHPHLREYFANQGRERNPNAWRAAHRRLYEHLCANTMEGDLPTLEELQPLYQAVVHGCQAGLHTEAYRGVFVRRIDRGLEAYSIKKLGAFGVHLGGVAAFFDQPWKVVSPYLNHETRPFMIHAAAFCLRALGRLAESLEPMRVSGHMDAESREWEGAAISYSELSDLELTLGEVARAVEDAGLSLTYANESGDETVQFFSHVAIGNALLQAGRRAEAETRFRHAERMQAQAQPIYLQLYSSQGFNYCDMLLATAEQAAWGKMTQHFCPTSSSYIETRRSQERAKSDRLKHATILKVIYSVSQRAANTLEISEENRWLLDIALDHLTLGRASLYVAILTGKADNPMCSILEREARSDASCLETARCELDAAVTGLRRAGTTNHVPRGLLTRAWLRSLNDARTGPESAQEDLDEAWEIAERGPMKLHMADVHLHRARLFFREDKYPEQWGSPEKDLKEARKLIESCGYGRRLEELQDAEAAILGPR